MYANQASNFRRSRVFSLIAGALAGLSATIVTNAQTGFSFGFVQTGRVVQVATAYASGTDDFSHAVGQEIVFNRLTAGESIPLPFGDYDNDMVTDLLVTMFNSVGKFFPDAVSFDQDVDDDGDNFDQPENEAEPEGDRVLFTTEDDETGKEVIVYDGRLDPEFVRVDGEIYEASGVFKKKQAGKTDMQPTEDTAKRSERYGETYVVVEGERFYFV